jgi:deazaflavin-dependent oxidoreductase (nitroreductase family)
MKTSPPDFNATIIDEFRANAGHVGGVWDDTPLLVLHHTGARSGKDRVNPLAYLDDGGRFVVIASNGGAPNHPAWYHNLKARPAASIEVGATTIDVIASEATGDERERLFRAQADRFPQLAEFERGAERRIPVVVLTPRASTPARCADMG